MGSAGKSENAFGYNGDLVTRVQAATNLRHFADLKKQAHAIHEHHLGTEMPFVPLWQLDPLYAHRKDKLEAVPFDAYRMFAQIERWQFQLR
jgi:hypothetical protein